MKPVRSATPLIAVCAAAVDRRRRDERSSVGCQYKTAGHQLAAINEETSRLRAPNAANPASLEHTARRQEKGQLRLTY